MDALEMKKMRFCRRELKRAHQRKTRLSKIAKSSHSICDMFFIISIPGLKCSSKLKLSKAHIKTIINTGTKSPGNRPYTTNFTLGKTTLVTLAYNGKGKKGKKQKNGVKIIHIYRRNDSNKPRMSKQNKRRCFKPKDVYSISKYTKHAFKRARERRIPLAEIASSKHCYTNIVAPKSKDGTIITVYRRYNKALVPFQESSKLSRIPYTLKKITQKKINQKVIHTKKKPGMEWFIIEKGCIKLILTFKRVKNKCSE